jgi:hypothetical protein
MSRTCLSTNLYTLDEVELENQNREIKHYFAFKLTQIDYMLYKIDTGYILDTMTEYKFLSIEKLREKLTKRLLDFANATKFRDYKVDRKRKSDRQYGYKGRYKKSYKKS